MPHQMNATATASVLSFITFHNRMRTTAAEAASMEAVRIAVLCYSNFGPRLNIMSSANQQNANAPAANIVSPNSRAQRSVSIRSVCINSGLRADQYPYATD